MNDKVGLWQTPKEQLEGAQLRQPLLSAKHTPVSKGTQVKWRAFQSTLQQLLERIEQLIKSSADDYLQLVKGCTKRKAADLFVKNFGDIINFLSCYQQHYAYKFSVNLDDINALLESYSNDLMQNNYEVTIFQINFINRATLVINCFREDLDKTSKIELDAIQMNILNETIRQLTFLINFVAEVRCVANGPSSPNKGSPENTGACFPCCRIS